MMKPLAQALVNSPISSNLVASRNRNSIGGSVVLPAPPSHHMSQTPQQTSATALKQFSSNPGTAEQPGKNAAFAAEALSSHHQNLYDGANGSQTGILFDMDQAMGGH